jgi:hypothetical protein
LFFNGKMCHFINEVTADVLCVGGKDTQYRGMIHNGLRIRLHFCMQWRKLHRYSSIQNFNHILYDLTILNVAAEITMI